MLSWANQIPIIAFNLILSFITVFVFAHNQGEYIFTDSHFLKIIQLQLIFYQHSYIFWILVSNLWLQLRCTESSFRHTDLFVKVIDCYLGSCRCLKNILLLCFSRFLQVLHKYQKEFYLLEVRHNIYFKWIISISSPQGLFLNLRGLCLIISRYPEKNLGSPKVLGSVENQRQYCRFSINVC